MAVGLAGFSGCVVGDLVWRAESLYDGPFPAPSNAVYLASYGLLGAGALAMVRTRRSGSNRAAFLDAAILTSGVAVLATVFVIAPVEQSSGRPESARQGRRLGLPGGRRLPAGDAREDVHLPGARNSSYRLLLAALGITTITDSTWNVLVAVSGDATPDRHWLDVGWLCAYVLVAAAANRSAMTMVAEPAPPTDVRPFGRRRVAGHGGRVAAAARGAVPGRPERRRDQPAGDHDRRGPDVGAGPAAVRRPVLGGADPGRAAGRARPDRSPGRGGEPADLGPRAVAGLPVRA